MRFTAVSVTHRPKDLDYDEMPYYCYSHEPLYWKRVTTGEEARRRVDHLARLWNRAHEKALEYCPETTHFLDIGSQCLHQTLSLRRLVKRYEQLDNPEIVLSGNIWARIETCLSPLVYRYQSYDTWAMPDLANLRYHFRSPSLGLVQVSSVAIPMIVPVEAWMKHPYHNPEDISRDGIWYNQFCREISNPVLADLSIRFYRTKYDSDIPSYSWTERVLRDAKHLAFTTLREASEYFHL